MGNKEGKANNVRVMRFAEVLLMYAEACAKTNDVTGASYALKLIRERAGLADKTFTQDQLYGSDRTSMFTRIFRRRAPV